MTGRLIARFRIWQGGPAREIELKGQSARSLIALAEAGRAGCTALECSTWAFRLAAYCHDLRRDHGLAIRCAREEHPGGWHGRYILETPVVVLAVETSEEKAA